MQTCQKTCHRPLVECGTQVLEKYNTEKDIAAHIKEFDRNTTTPGTVLLGVTLVVT